MSRSKTYRPRLSREVRDEAFRAAEQLKGEEVNSLPEALGLLLSYFDALNGNVGCPECGEQPIEQSARGKWSCWNCNHIVTIYDLLETEDPDKSDIPVLPRTQ